MMFIPAETSAAKHSLSFQINYKEISCFFLVFHDEMVVPQVPLCLRLPVEWTVL